MILTKRRVYVAIGLKHNDIELVGVFKTKDKAIKRSIQWLLDLGHKKEEIRIEGRSDEPNTTFVIAGNNRCNIYERVLE